jgi:hypothetical protein
MFIGGGDFNARIGQMNDFLVDIDEVPQRDKIDDVVNKHGEAFLEFLMSSKLCVLNGRVKGEDTFTCIKPQGRSVVDYFMTQLDSLKHVNHFYVKTVKDLLQDMNIMPTSTVPDHSVLITDVGLSDYAVVKRQPRVSSKSNEYDKQYNVSEIPPDFMTDGAVVNDIVAFVGDLDTLESTQSCIHNVY